MAPRRVPTPALAVGLLVVLLVIAGRAAGGHSAPPAAVPHAAARGAGAAGPAPASTTPSGSATDRRQPSTPATPGPDHQETPAPAGERLDIVRHIAAGRGAALTFDDGPNPTWTPQLLDLLKAAHVKATFCLIGAQVRAYPGLVRRIVSEGHTLCNHSWHHDMDLGTWSETRIRADLERTNAEIHRAAPGARIAYFRHPGGFFTPAAVQVARELGMKPLGWSVDTRDWSRPGSRAIIHQLLDNVRRGSIVLMHDGGGDRSETLAACRQTIAVLKGRFPLVPLG